VLPNLSLKVRSAARPVLVVPFALLLLGIAFATLAPRYSPAAASGYALARVSLLWILVPFVAVSSYQLLRTAYLAKSGRFLLAGSFRSAWSSCLPRG
jgi:hypothetical protein